MKHIIICALIFACAFVASVSGLGYAVRIMHDGPDCAPAHKIIHISFEVHYKIVRKLYNITGFISDFYE